MSLYINGHPVMHTDKYAGMKIPGTTKKKDYFFLWRFFLKRFLRLCVAIL